MIKKLCVERLLFIEKNIIYKIIMLVKRPYFSEVPDFLELNRQNFLQLFKLISVSNASSVKILGFEVIFYFNKVKLSFNSSEPSEYIRSEKSYNSSLYVPIQLKSNQVSIFKSKILYVLLGDIPIITYSGNFIISGYSKILTNRLLRSPGFYIDSYSIADTSIVRAIIIPEKGNFFTIEKRRSQIWVLFGSTRIAIFVFLQSLGLTQKKIFQSVNRKDLLIKSLNSSNPCSTLDALRLLSLDLGLKGVLETRKFLQQNLRSGFDLGELGRFRLNNKLGITDDIKSTVLRPQDILAAVNYLTNLDYRTVFFDDIDSLANKRFASSGEIFNQLIKTSISSLITEMNKSVRKLKSRRAAAFSLSKKLKFVGYISGSPRCFYPFFYFSKISHLSQLRQTSYIKKNISIPIRKFLGETITESIEELFNTNEISQFTNDVNSLEEITQKRKLYLFNDSHSNLGLKLREIQSSQLGRICPLETPEGKIAGLIGSLATYARTKNGFIECPFHRVKRSTTSKSSAKFFLSANQEENVSLSFNGEFNSGSNLKEIIVKFNKDFIPMKISDISFVCISPIQMISVATSLIPFLEHNDGNRALMGSNMQRQAVPLLYRERPIVGTGLEISLGRYNGSVVIAKSSGIVTNLNSKRIVVSSFEKLNNCKKIDNKNYWKKFSNKLMYPSLVRETEFLRGMFNIKNCFKDLATNFLVNKTMFQNTLATSTKSFENKTKVYHLQNFTISNTGTLTNQAAIVRAGEWVKKGDLLADSSTTKNGELALGKNLLVAYMPWHGYNFEDAIVISESLVQNDILSSIHVEAFQIPSSIDLRKKNFISDTRSLKNLDSNGIIKVGTWVNAGDVIVLQSRREPSLDNLDSHEVLLYTLFGDLPIPDKSFKVPSGKCGRIIDVKFLETSIKIYLATKKQVKLGDKISGRHGNKGIISKILPVQDMPYTQDGTSIEVILNPLGVPSRMNMGQLLECSLGLAGFFLKENYRILPFDEIYGPFISRTIVFNKLYEAKRKTGKSWIFQPNNPGKSYIFDGKSGYNFQNYVTVGYSYLMKLNHLVDHKMIARSSGGYSGITNQPLGGRSRRGGQRLGEMEVWALEGFGAAFNLQELLTIKSDSVRSRQDLLRCIVQEDDFPKPDLPESFKVLIRELKSLCVDVGLNLKS